MPEMTETNGQADKAQAAELTKAASQQPVKAKLPKRLLALLSLLTLASVSGLMAKQDRKSVV